MIQYIQIQGKYVQCVSLDKVSLIFQKSIRKKSLLACYVHEKWLTNLHFSLEENKQLSEVV